MPAGLFDPEFDAAQPLVQPAPVKQANKWKELAPLLVAALTAAKTSGRVGVASLLQGFQQSRQQQAQDERQAGLDAENRSYRDATLQTQRDRLAMDRAAKLQADANADTMRRQQFLTQYGAGFEGLDTPEAVQAYVALQQAQGRTIGVNPDELARLAPTPAALSQKRAAKALEKLQKARPDDWMNWSVKVDGQDVKASDLLGLSRDPSAAPVTKVTYGPPEFYRVGKSIVQLRPGSDGKMYNDQGQAVTGAQPYQPPSTAQPDFVTLLSPDGKTQRLVPKSRANTMLEQGWHIFDAVAARQSNAPDTKEAQAITEDAIKLLDRVRDDPYLGAATGMYEMRGRIPGWAQGVADLNAVRDQLVNTLALPNLGALKGPMSDKDIVFIKNISSRLANTNLSYGETVKALDEARMFLERKLGRSVPKQTKQSGPVMVRTPQGAFSFPDQAAADAFKREAGIP